MLQVQPECLGCVSWNAHSHKEVCGRFHLCVCISPLFCEDRATTRAGSISQGKPAADDSSYTFMATWEPIKRRMENKSQRHIGRRGSLTCMCLYVCFTFMSVSLGMWSLKSSTELTRKGMWQDNTCRKRETARWCGLFSLPRQIASLSIFANLLTCSYEAVMFEDVWFWSTVHQLQYEKNKFKLPQEFYAINPRNQS